MYDVSYFEYYYSSTVVDMITFFGNNHKHIIRAKSFLALSPNDRRQRIHYDDVDDVGIHYQMVVNEDQQTHGQ